ncbi:Protein of unknown function [Ornithinibacillus halophilus]|uniref:DUF4003 domain-containing protein n=2 Tax=Ornithinibacillus halophilus TaxID=930117 RepID=A0A1M5JEU1_9BACI|nr:Protein of unknown function [Ornithinibacillus halophilus]
MEIIEQYIKEYQQLKIALKWKVPDKTINMAIAANYVMKDKEIDSDKLLIIADTIKSQAGLFSSMKSHSRFLTASIMDINFENPTEQVPELFTYYKQFRNEKFSSGTFTYIAATLLLVSELNPDEIIPKAKDLYDRMKQEHAFLTTASDYPLATLLTIEGRTDTIEQMETFYEELSKNGFSKGNDLQFLSHILSLPPNENSQTLISRAISVYDSLKVIGIRSKRTYYPVIGMLALLPNEELDMKKIKDLYDRLMLEKDFKWQKDVNVMMAVNFFVKGKLEHTTLAETSLYTVVEAIIQAQQAVMTASIVAAATASNSNNN